MIKIQTVYPCPKCGIENPPSHEYCSRCGHILPDWAQGNIYNVFYKKSQAKAYNMMFLGGPILTFEDARDVAWEHIKKNHGRLEFHIAAFSANTEIQEGVGFSVKEWYDVDYQHVTNDLGPQMVRVTFLE